MEWGRGALQGKHWHWYFSGAAQGPFQRAGRALRPASGLVRQFSHAREQERSGQEEVHRKALPDARRPPAKPTPAFLGLYAVAAKELPEAWRSLEQICP